MNNIKYAFFGTPQREGSRAQQEYTIEESYTRDLHMRLQNNNVLVTLGCPVLVGGIGVLNHLIFGW